MIKITAAKQYSVKNETDQIPEPRVGWLVDQCVCVCVELPLDCM